MTKVDELPPDLRAMVLSFRAEMIAERKAQERRLRETLDHLKREVEIERAHLKRETEIEVDVLQRLMEIVKGTRPSDSMATHATQ
jgi:hypothetical protein